MEFELAYYNFTVQHISRNATGTTTFFYLLIRYGNIKLKSQIKGNNLLLLSCRDYCFEKQIRNKPYFILFENKKIPTNFLTFKEDIRKHVYLREYRLEFARKQYFSLREMWKMGEKGQLTKNKQQQQQQQQKRLLHLGHCLKCERTEIVWEEKVGWGIQGRGLECRNSVTLSIQLFNVNSW